MSSGAPPGLHSSLSQTNPQMESKGRKKIQFSVAVPPSQMDPRAVEMIRRRRPTPATLFRVSDQQSPEDDPTIYQKLTGDAQPLKRSNPCAYIPPSMKAVQRLVQSHMQSLETFKDNDDDEDDIEDDTDDTEPDTEEPTSNEQEECVGRGDEGASSNNLETLLNHTVLEDREDTMDTANTPSDKVCDKHVVPAEHP
ncbi:protein phosphatase 1 regulatory subunit 1B isoform X2 [Hyla sarda]|uniref:protein phosphatase 1 regulatory subunit 1B isoform X2 n=1 Tax=Hyla sarda TaxID=327740 RepID=UPI0024C21A1B|nr:protein phosphatase 1 regulatory subunit 1B isoform X2 [Hyla sarda]